MRDRHGNVVTEEEARALLRRERPGKPRTRSPDPTPAGYAGVPGRGPAGETCRTCRHLFRNRLAKTYLKCSLMEWRWTGSRKTDILAGSPACERWEAPE
jgi:hypothetical protein